MEKEKDIASLVKAYQNAVDLDDRLRSADQVVDIVGPPLKAFVLRHCPEHFDDVFQDVLIGIVQGWGRFRGSDWRMFWSFCYTIARRKICDRFKQKSWDNRFVPADAAEILEIMETVEGKHEMSAADRVDYEYLVDLLMKSKPECGGFLYKRHVLGWSYKLIARHYGLAVPTARMRKNRCLEHAQKLAAKNA